MEFLAYTQFLYVKSDFTGPNKRHIYYPWPRIKMAKIEVLWASIYRWIIPLIVKIFIECLIWVNRPQIYVILVTFIHQENWKCTRINLNIVCLNQGYKARKVISEVYAFFVLQCTVFGRKSKHKTDVTAWMLLSSDTKRTLMHLFLFTNSAQRELVSICTHSIHDRN